MCLVVNGVYVCVRERLVWACDFVRTEGFDGVGYRVELGPVEGCGRHYRSHEEEGVMSRRREGINWSGVCLSCRSTKLGKSGLCRLPRSSRKSYSGLKETFRHGDSRWMKLNKFANDMKVKRRRGKTRYVLRNTVSRYARVDVVV